MIEITYTTEIVRPYIEGLKDCQSRDDLLKFLVEWKDIAPDALAQVQNDQFDWNEYRQGAAKERKGIFSGEAWVLKYGNILLPAIPFFVAQVADRFYVPDGTAFIRLQQENIIHQEPDGSYTLHLPPI